MPPRNTEKRTEILKVTYSLLSESDYDAVSLSSIAKAVGIKQPLLQHFYPYKVNIMETILRDFLEKSAGYLEQFDYSEGAVFQRGADNTMLFFRAATEDSGLRKLVNTAAYRAELQTLWIDITCAWMEELYSRGKYSYLQIRSAFSFGIPGALYLFSKKDELGIDYKYVVTMFIRTVMYSLNLDSQIEDTLKITEEHMKQVDTKEFLEYCNNNIEWFTAED